MKAYSTYYYKCKLIRENGVKFETIHDSTDVVNLVQKLDLLDACEEYMYLICLDVKGQAIGYHEISHGDLSATSASPREIFKRALLNNAAGIILVHNHPSGCPVASDDDIIVTKRVLESGQVLGIKLIDHIIVAGSEHFKYVSLKADGLISD